MWKKVVVVQFDVPSRLLSEKLRKATKYSVTIVASRPWFEPPTS